MNKDLAEIITTYATQTHEELAKLLLGKSKDNLIACLNDLLTIYINDKNSSTLREFITVSVAGYEHSTEKLGYNGFKQDTKITGKPINCEAKPKNIQSKNYENKKNKPKLNGEGGFNDYTYKRLEKDKQANLNLLCSGFIDGELQYILEFLFDAICGRLEQELKKLKGPYLRSATFNFSHYKNSKELKIVYINKMSIEQNKRFFNKKFYQFLMESK
jgi:hypothetical protein